MSATSWARASRLAAALDTDEKEFPAVLRERLRRPFKPIEVPSSQAPVHEVVLTGDDADLTTLPVHLQHGLDGAPYISASIDYAQDGKTGFTNLGCRRMMLRGPRAAGIDLVAPSDLKAIYSGRGGEGRAAAGRLHGRQPPDRFSRRGRLDAADGRVATSWAPCAARRCRWSNARPST